MIDLNTIDDGLMYEFIVIYLLGVASSFMVQFRLHRNGTWVYDFDDDTEDFLRFATLMISWIFVISVGIWQIIEWSTKFTKFWNVVFSILRVIIIPLVWIWKQLWKERTFKKGKS